MGTATFFIGFVAGRRKDRITQTFAFLNEWRSPEYTAARDYVVEVVKPKLTDEVVGRGLRALDQADMRVVRRVTHLLDYAGTAMLLGFIDEKLLVIEIGGSVHGLWGILGRLVLAERKTRAESVTEESRATTSGYDFAYQAGFEHIAEHARTFPKKHSLRYSEYRWPSPRAELPEPDRRGRPA